jgi:hypothetical protein
MSWEFCMIKSESIFGRIGGMLCDSRLPRQQGAGAGLQDEANLLLPGDVDNVFQGYEHDLTVTVPVTMIMAFEIDTRWHRDAWRD